MSGWVSGWVGADPGESAAMNSAAERRQPVSMWKDVRAECGQVRNEMKIRAAETARMHLWTCGPVNL